MKQQRMAQGLGPAEPTEEQLQGCRVTSELQKGPSGERGGLEGKQRVKVGAGGPQDLT